MSYLSDFIQYFDHFRPAIGGAFCVLGAALAIVGSVGVLRFPDFYTRLHAASATDTGAVTIMVIGMALLSPDLGVFIRLLAILFFMYITGPASSHAIANAAHVAGVEPIIGRVGAQADKEQL